MNAAVAILNAKVVAAHYAHYERNTTGLIDTSNNASPNENQIYHLYSDGNVTYQKGAWAYLARSEFDLEDPVMSSRDVSKFGFKFVIDARAPYSYAILTLAECRAFRKEMMEIVKAYKE